MNATIQIDLNDRQGRQFLQYARTLPFARVIEDETPPCQYSVEELRERIDQGLEDIRAGRFHTNEEVFKPYRQWL